MTTTRTENPDQLSNQKKALVIGAVALLTIGSIYSIYLLLKRKAARIKKSPFTVPDKNNRREEGFQCRSKNYPLNPGTCHPDVGILQRYLKVVYKAGLGTSGIKRDGVDEKYGKATRAASIKHLKKNTFSPSDIARMKTSLKITHT